MMALDEGTMETAMGRRLRALLLAGCCAALLAGCSSFDNWLTGEDTTSGAAETANAEEAAAEQEDYPKITDIPESPRQGLVSDSGNAQYSDQDLRAETPGANERVMTRSPSGQPETVPQTTSNADQAAVTSEDVGAPSEPKAPAEPQSQPQSQSQPSTQATPTTPAAPQPQMQPQPQPQPQPRMQAQSAPAAGAQPLYDRGNSPVTVNLDAIGGPPAGSQLAYAGGQPYATAPAGGNRVAVIQFGYGSAALDGQDREVLRQVVALQRQYGGSIQVVGHASAKTGVMSVERHNAANLQISQARARAVRDELVRLGAPANGVTAQGAGDTQPLYGEMMATGEAGNRRADIYLVR
jgi:outer membrane protein OmpA-like peptidoglycan-associated protein